MSRCVIFIIIIAIIIYCFNNNIFILFFIISGRSKEGFPESAHPLTFAIYITNHPNIPLKDVGGL